MFHPANLDGYVETMHRGVAQLGATMAGLTGPSTGTSPEHAAKLVTDVDLDRPLGDAGAALGEMSRLWLEDTVWFHDPGYAAHLNCPVVIPALLAEVFVSGVNASLDTFDQSVGATFMERHLVDWTAGRIGFGETADGIFTSGGTQSNLQGLLLARDRALAGRARGELARLRVVASTDGHFSVQKAARLLGLGDEAVITVPVDERHRMDVPTLARALAGCAARGEVAMAVVATAGTTDFGAIDPLPAVAELCHLHDTWLHVDAAYGGGLLASTRRRHLLTGIERADSVTVDFHKTWFQPVSSSALIVREAHHLGHVTWHADYLNPEDPDGTGHPNQVDKSLQTTRRFDALKLWMTLRVMGPDRIGDYVDTVCDLAQEVHARLAHRDDIEVAAPPGLSTIVFRYRPAGLEEDRADELVPRIRQELYDSGRAMVAATKVDGRCWLKLTLLNPMTTCEDVLAIIDRVATAGRELGVGAGAVA
nr:aspartate aminotransferase family protein [Nocardioides sp. zg-DK7169]